MARSSCTSWAKTNRASGRMAYVRTCGKSRADIVHGDRYWTYNVYRNGTWTKRGSAKTLRAAKAAATRAMNKKK